MNCRENERFDVNFDVVMCYDSIGLVRGGAKNLSSTGVFVKTSAVYFPLNARIKAAFSCDTPKGRCQLSIDAKVIRSTSKGVALEFDQGVAAACLPLNNYLAMRQQTTPQQAQNNLS